MVSQKMRICIITSSYPSRSDDFVQAPFLIEFIEELKKRGHRVFVFTQDRQGLKEQFLDGVQVKWFPWMGSGSPLVRLNVFHPMDFLRIVSLFYQGRRALLPFLRENRVEACLALWVLPGGYFANYAFRMTRIPYSVWALGSDIYRYGANPFLYRVMKRVIEEAKGVFADGFDLAKRVEERFQRRCFFLATTRGLRGYETTIQAGSIRRGQFLFVGRLEKVKGIDLLLRSMALLKEEGREAHLTIVGKGSLEKWAKDFVEKNGLGPSVTMLGNVPDETLVSLYASSDCVVIPSRLESIPVVFSEALSFDREMIVADVGDLGTLGRKYGVAHVVPSEDPPALKEAMKERLDRMGCKTGENEKRAELKRLFGADTSVERFLADYS
jgi:glycosyltransferase involved in cell wall biosynthesis